ncbi:MAG: hypothetical protein C4539_08165 [Ignavibacteriales bacterium]|nr:MAG: hypothetical protein C4539_08165 [Ignavibacteriales bacterium]
MKSKTLIQLKYFLLILFLLSLWLFSCKKIEPEQTKKADTTDLLLYTAFINDDKFEDTIKVIPIEKNVGLRNITIVNLWDTTEVSKFGEPLSFRLKFGNSTKEFLLHDSSFFSTPIWSSDSLPIGLLKKNDSEFVVWERSIPGLSSDAIVLGTEAGIDILLYWNGEEFRLFWPDEEP